MSHHPQNNKKILKSLSILEINPNIIITLDEQIVKTQICISSPFAQTFIESFKEWLQKLISLQRVLNKYEKAQTKWTSLEPLFSAGL